MTKILSFCNEDYIEIALNWVAHLNSLGIHNYYVVYLDEETKDALTNSTIFKGSLINAHYGGDVDFLKGCNNTVHRLLFICMNMMLEGDDILMCDLDALWLKNPMPLLESRNEDVIFSTVRHKNAFPKEMFRKMGFTCCMGWVLFRCNEKTISYINSVYNSGVSRSVKPTGSDQKLFNNYLVNHLLLVCKDDIGDVFRSDYTEQGETKCLSILCLNKEIVKRGPISEGTYVWHPNTRKEASYKKEVFRHHDKWLI